jgi:phosphatidylglycerophosphatase A
MPEHRRPFALLRLLPDQLITGMATIGPVGRTGRAPGTLGSLVGLLLYTVVWHGQAPYWQLFYTLLAAAVAVAICDEAERRLGKRDPGEIILDEVVAVPLCFFGLGEKMARTGHVWVYLLAGFLLFRLFDIAKPFGIARLQRQPGGWGVVIDDLAAAALVCLALHGAGRLFA